MTIYYRDARTGEVTTNQYGSDPAGNTWLNKTIPFYELPQVPGTTQVTTANGGQAAIPNTAWQAYQGEYGPAAQRQAMAYIGEMTGRSIGGNNQPDVMSPQQQQAINMARAAAGIFTGQGAGEGAASIATRVAAAAGGSQSAKTFREYADEAAINRPNYYGDIGDTKSAAVAAGLQMMSMFGMANPQYSRTPESAQATALESLRQYYGGRAGEEPGMGTGTARAQYYSGELQKLISRPIELASSYHNLSMATGIPVPANPHEYMGDLAVEFLKGAPQKASEMFSPVSGEMSKSLPKGGYGLQQWSWDTALHTDKPTSYTEAPSVSYIPAINALYAAKGQYGPYATLFGGPDYIGSPSSEGIRKQAGFVFTDEDRRNVEVAISKAVSEYGPMTGLKTVREYSSPLVIGEPVLKTTLPAVTPTAPTMARGPDGNLYPVEFMQADPTGWKPITNQSDPTGRLVGGKIVASCAAIVKNQSRYDEAVGKNVAGQAGALPTTSSTSWTVTTITTLPAPFISSPIQSENPFFEGVSKSIAKFPILGDFYRMGAGVDADTVAGLKATLSSAPFFESIYRGGELFGAMKNYEAHPSFTGPAQSAGKTYQRLAGSFVGTEKTENMVTYPIAKPFLDVGEAYREGVTKPVESVIGKGVIQSAVMGIVDVPGSIPDTIGMTIVGGERTVKNIPNFPGLAASGVAMAADAAFRDPVRFAAALAGTYGLFRGTGIVTQKGIGLVRTRGMEYVPLENIGYGPEGRYPLNPTQSETMLARSFREGILYPEPVTMAEGGPVPYLHGKAGIPAARLPNAQPGDVTLWTALESSSRTRGVPVGDAYALETSGGSEVRGMYAAPILESYFLKAGNKPQMIGFDLPFKTPTAYSTVVQGVEAVPKSVRRTAATGDWTRVNEYITQRSQTVPAGQAFMPLMKAEYEAVVPDFTALEITGRNYYTKVGGIGESHFLGTRIPIVEQRAIGFDVAGSQQAVSPAGQIKNTIPDYYRPPAKIGGYSLSGAVEFSMGYGLSDRSVATSTRSDLRAAEQLGYSGDTRATLRGSIPPYESTAGKRSTISSLSDSMKSTYSNIYNPSIIKSLTSPRGSYTLPYSDMSSIKPYEYSGRRYIESSSAFTSSRKTTVPYTDGGGGVLIPPIGSLLSGGGGLPGRRRLKYFAELLPLGLDIGARGVPMMRRAPAAGPKRRPKAKATKRRRK